MTDANVPAGWYPDPDDPTQQRWWDGAQWTENRVPASPGAPEAPSEPAPGAPSNYGVEQPWTPGGPGGYGGAPSYDAAPPYAGPAPGPGTYGSPYGQEPYPGQYAGGPFPPGGPPPSSSSSRTPLIIALAVAIVAALVGLGVFLLSGDDEEDPVTGSTTTQAPSSTTPTTSAPTTDTTGTDTSDTTSGDPTGDDEAGPPTEPPTGDSAEFDQLAQDCYQGDMTACDDLFLESDVGSDYEAYGASCGGRLPDHQGRYCEPTITDPINPD